MSIQEKIFKLKKEKNAIILAHYYQEAAIQDLADVIGDSLELAKKALEMDAEIIVFAGVHFMAETTKILNPNKRVLVPDMEAGCSLADNCQPEAFRSFLDQYPDHLVVSYINSSAEIKAVSDYVCTSSNAEAIIRSISPERSIVFAPDRNLGNYLSRVTGRELVLWDASCIVHEAFSIDKLLNLHKQYPDAEIIAHPESEEPVRKVARYIGSTSKLISYAQRSPKGSFIVATEAGILFQMQRLMPEKIFIPAPSVQDNTCACSECAYMKVNSVEKIYHCLLYEKPEIRIPEKLRVAALQPLKRMLEF